jgi:hypothetical protein
MWPAPPEFDVVTKLWSHSLKDLEKIDAAWRDPKIAAEISADEKNVFDTRPDAMVMFLVEERITPDSWINGARKRIGFGRELDVSSHASRWVDDKGLNLSAFETS